MAFPPILLREFQTATISDFIPGKLATEYQQLESLAHAILSKDDKQYNVHFHFHDGLCEGKALPLLWDNGAYFDSDCLKDNKLHLYAHFERKDGRNSLLNTPATSAAPSSSRLPTEAPSQSIARSSAATELNRVGTSGGVRGSSSRQSQVALSIPRRERRANAHDLSDTDSDASDETNFLLSPSDSGRLSNSEEGREGPLQKPQPLPATTTAIQHAADFEEACLTNAPKGKYGHKDNWKDIDQKYKDKIAHAKLTKGTYGVVSAKPCDRCAEKGVTCRVYHPDLQGTRATGGSCGECRLRSMPCDLNGRPQNLLSKRKRASEASSEKSHPKILRRSTGGEPTGMLNFCPIVTCPRRRDSLGNKANLLRHVQSAHPEYDASRLDPSRRVSVPSFRAASTPTTVSAPLRTPKGMGTFVCPIAGCLNPSSTRGDNFRRHIRQGHPESIHAQILEAIVGRSKIQLPPPPSSAEYTADFEIAVSENATLGAFGRRSDNDWSALSMYIRTRIAHAKLINGKYGVLAPESCANCRRRGTACMVYHPHLDGGGRVPGSYCNECRDRSVKCEITADVFSKILLAPGDTASGQEVNNVETDSQAHAPKEEDYEQADDTLVEEHYRDDGDSFVRCSVPGSPYEAEHDREEELPEGSEEAVSTAAISDQASPEDSAFYQYSKYADQGLGSAIGRGHTTD
ncbi:hypothetical protein HBH69_153780 [Parastagonospora nodorum]|nr:hypothetical protein HBI09_161050 [Parastagonospora nodorum]KAH4999529.1 hypothetical protein HBI77_172120 [Parastagonospora nodorum]KAH5091326.1 hypothetical protein HBH72_204610 [Parastagonospora nodorum]KAH5150554.1 hypothetical protein HBH69_153780 [Parastagonospora nodorum]KAH5219426.1 hypothetical protein HBI62_147460 [Parastagonospora nodorum]